MLTTSGESRSFAHKNGGLRMTSEGPEGGLLGDLTREDLETLLT
jgi:hypothetical protein